MGLAVFLGLLVWHFLTVFAALYVSVAHADPAAFSERLSRTDSLYFTIVVFGTVGFGDIAPRSDVARLLVSAQILIDLVVLGTIVRLLFFAARRSLREAGTEGPPQAPLG